MLFVVVIMIAMCSIMVMAVMIIILAMMIDIVILVMSAFYACSYCYQYDRRCDYHCICSSGLYVVFSRLILLSI